MPSTDPSELKICETLTYICLYGKNVTFLPPDYYVIHKNSLHQLKP